MMWYCWASQGHQEHKRKNAVDVVTMHIKDESLTCSASKTKYILVEDGTASRSDRSYNTNKLTLGSSSLLLNKNRVVDFSMASKKA